MKSVLILGAGVMQGPAIRIARDKGYRVLVADGNASACNARAGDEFLHIDLKDKEALAEAAAAVPGLAGVFTAGTDFSASVAFVAEALGLPGIPYEAALDASDKARMRARLAAAGVPVPAFAYGTAADDPAVLAESVSGLPLVVKPVDNMGARGCMLARTPDELRTAWKDATGYSRTGRAIVEAYLDGPEFSLDAIVYEGRVTLRGLADRIIRFEPYFVEMGHTMPSAYGPEVLDEVTAVFKAGVAALGIHTGAAKGDIKYTRDGAFVGEIAARLSGGYMSGWTYPYASGIDATADAIDIACGVEPRLAEPSRDWVCAERAYISIPGVVADIVGTDEARALSGVTDLFPRSAVGDRVAFPVNNVEKCGNVLAVSPDRALAESAAEAAARSVLLRLEPGDPETARFLDSGAEWPPAAYSGLSAMVLASLDCMPDILRAEKPYGSVSIAPLDGSGNEDALDWQGRGIGDALAAVRRLTGAATGMDGDIVVGRRFWRALFRGGYQAAAWIVDTVRADMAAGKGLAER